MTHLMTLFDRVRTEHNQTAARIRCSEPGCKNTTDVVYTMTSLPPEFVAKKARQRNWEIDKHGHATCPTCIAINKVARRKEHPPMKPAPDIAMPPEVATLPPRQPTQTDLRRIMREIDENWDEPKARYAGAATDKSIAEKLNVPRAWVVEERKRAFGDSTRNELTDKMIDDLKLLKDMAEQRAKRALDAAAECEAVAAEIGTQLKKLERML
jgi:hypothetical protein